MEKVINMAIHLPLHIHNDERNSIKNKQKIASIINKTLQAE